MRGKLIRKFAECIDDLDLTGFAVGDVFQVPPRSAALLIAEGWAEPIEFDKSSEGRKAVA